LPKRRADFRSREFPVLFRHLKAVAQSTEGRLENIAPTFQRESPLFAHRRTHQTGFKGVSRYAYGYAAEARVVVAYREIEYRGTFYLERVVAASSSSEDFIARVE
jgi:hypothetical protein